MQEKIISIEDYYKDSKKVILNEAEFRKFLNGAKFDINTKDKIVRVYFNDLYKGLGIVENNVMKRYIVE